jgi:hypothetical protein
MRTLFLLLVLANLLAFAWWRYLSPADAGLDRQPLARQIEPDKLKIVSPAELARLPAKKPAAPAAPAIASGPAVATPVPAVAAAAPATATPGPAPCLEWGSFTLADAPKAEKALEPLALGSRLAQRRTEELAGWWVFIPSQGSRQAALRKATELKGLGVEEFFVLSEEGPFRWAVSLGVFRNEDAAQARLAALRTQGVRTARVGPRELLVPKIWLQVKSVDAPLEARLKEIARQIEGSELKACPPS